MQGEHTRQASFFGIVYEDLSPANRLLRQLAAVVDFSFVSDLVSDCYCSDNGRPSSDPLVWVSQKEIQKMNLPQK